MKPLPKRRYRLLDGMAFVAATAVAFAIFRKGLPPGLTFTTFGWNGEQFLFFWMRQVVPFLAMWSLALVAIAAFERGTPPRRRFRPAGIAGCFAAVAALMLTTLIASTFYSLHALEELGKIPKIFTHNSNAHGMPPFANAPMEEIVGAAVVGAWSWMAAIGRWRSQPSWIDRAGRVLSAAWIGIFLVYLYGYTG